jgi:S1-C subfamily serine protease
VSRIILYLSVITACAQLAVGAEPEKSVIQINTFSQQPVWDAPWRFESVRRASGSGFVIRGKRIMTNAHVVSWAKQVQVRRYQDPRPYMAHVAFIAHDSDLALLEVDSDGFFDGLQPLDLGDLPKVRSTVVTYGYPAGGEQISYTRGVVSRIELQSYVHIGNRSLLAVQTDAAINPGNSGGPVIQDDKVVGVAFQGAPGLENTGFFIPTAIIEHFLKDIEDGTYDGFPQAGIRLVPLQNPAYRRYLKLSDNDLGAKIDHIYPVPTTVELLQEEDVLLQVGPYPVGSDGTIVYEGNRLHAALAFSKAQNGQSVPLKIWHQGKELKIDLPLSVIHDDHAEGNQYVLPRYFVYAGLVFTPLSRDYLRTFGPNWADAASAELIYELFYRRQEEPKLWRTEPIVMCTVLSHPVNANLMVRGRGLVDKINGVRIENLEDVIRAFESSAGAYDSIEFITQHALECLDRAGARQASPEILKTYGLPNDRRL